MTLISFRERFDLHLNVDMYRTLAMHEGCEAGCCSLPAHSTGTNHRKYIGQCSCEVGGGGASGLSSLFVSCKGIKKEPEVEDFGSSDCLACM